MKRPELRVEGSAFAGKRFTIPAIGLRLGRSSSNDIPVHDSELSRNHCLFEQSGEDGIRVTDLASANGTFVNGERLGTESADLKPGDVIRVGATTITIVGEDTPEDGIDLGLGKKTVERGSVARAPAPTSRLRPILWSVALLALGAAAWLMLAPPETSAPPSTERVAEKSELVEMRYEKVAADSNTIFRYCLSLESDGTLCVVIDDTADNRHTDKRIPLKEKARKELTDILTDDGFATLRSAYTGPEEEPPKLASWTLACITTSSVREVTVVNTLEPEAFRRVRERLETFAENELGIHAWHYSREELLKMAHEAGDTAQMKWEDRDVEYGNLHAAICAYRKAISYLETLNPKPAEFGRYNTALERAVDELDTRCRKQRFTAEQAMSTGDWELAQAAFRTLREMIPDTEDERNHEATLKLIDIEKRLGRKGGR